jgi:hypothetical protein
MASAIAAYKSKTGDFCKDFDVMAMVSSMRFISFMPARITASAKDERL